MATEPPLQPYAPPKAPLHETPTATGGSRGIPVTRCTECGLEARHPPVVQRGSGGLAILLLTGIIPYLLWGGQRKRPFRCCGCGSLFYARTTAAKICLGLLLLTIAATIVALM